MAVAVAEVHLAIRRQQQAQGELADIRQARVPEEIDGAVGGGPQHMRKGQRQAGAVAPIGGPLAPAAALAVLVQIAPHVAGATVGQS